MSGYVRDVRITVPFDGQEVIMILRPLKRGDVMKLEGELGGKSIRVMRDELDAIVPEEGKEPEQVPTLPDYLSRLLDAYADLLPGYVVEHNLTDAAGEVIPTEEWVAAAYFRRLIMPIWTEHMMAAIPRNP